MSCDENPIRRAKALFANGDYLKAILLLEEGLSECDCEALALLGNAYQLGLGIPADGEKAVGLLSRASDLGSGMAAHNLGTLYITGATGLPPNRELALAAYRRAKELGVVLGPPWLYE